MTPEQTETADTRIGQWRGAIEQELQELITRAAKLREQSNTAKTTTKRVYYQRKFKKITTDVMQMVTAMQRIDAHKAALEEAKQESSQDAAAPTT